MATGTLGTLDNQIDTTTGTVKLRALFANPDEQLYPNQFVNARLLVSTMQNTVRVPVPAVQRGEPGTYVYVINANSTVSVRPIKVGPTDGGYMAVLSGLQVGEKVVTDGTDRLRDGAPVIVPPPAQGQSKGGDGGQGQGTGQGHQHGSGASRRHRQQGGEHQGHAQQGHVKKAWGRQGLRLTGVSLARFLRPPLSLARLRRPPLNQVQPASPQSQ